MVKKILVVDDDSGDSKKMKSILQTKNYQVDCAKNGAEAIDFVDKTNFDLILLDVKMPTLSGYDLLRLLKNKENVKSKIIYVTVVPKKEVVLEDIDGFAQKPFSSESLIREVKKVLK